MKNQNLAEPLFISREDLCERWGGISMSSLKRKEARGELKRVALFPRRVFYRLSEVEAIEEQAGLTTKKGGR